MIVGTCKAFKAWLAALTLLALAAITPAPIRSQVAGASLSGTVSDPSGAPLVGAKVAIENLATGVSRDTTTDTSGFYIAPNLLPGTYEIAISAPGFATQVRKGITLTVGGQQTLNFEMKVGGVNEKVEVTGEAPFVQTTSSDRAYVSRMPLSKKGCEIVVRRQDSTNPAGGTRGIPRSPGERGGVISHESRRSRELPCQI